MSLSVPESSDVAALPGSSLASPFETWCDSVGLHPEDWRAWPMFEATLDDEAQVA